MHCVFIRPARYRQNLYKIYILFRKNSHIDTTPHNTLLLEDHLLLCLLFWLSNKRRNMEEVYDAEDDWDEDEATQYMIEQSLLEYSKHADSTARYS